MISVGVDTGGTFTDFIFYRDGTWGVLKIPSTPDDPSRAVLEGLERIGGKGRRIVHGSTVATNALLERKGARTALVTNARFEDVIEIGRQNRRRLYDLHYRRGEPLVPRELRFGVKGRISFRGEILEDIDPQELEDLVNRLAERGVESVAVCLLHSYANPVHEEEIGKVLEEKLRVHVSLSHRILPEFREYERTSTTVINAYVSPRMERYLRALEDKIHEDDRLSVMQSSGGTIPVSVAAREAVRTILSGPAGGVISALHLGKLTGREKLITFDMGGTSTDVSLIDRTPTITSESEVDGFPVKVPMIDIHTIGAGGGSIARAVGGVLRVGPQSAGADPGPICYRRGGREITVTDANLFLGRLVPERFLGGSLTLHRDLLEEPFRRLAEELHTEPLRLAEAIVEIANSSMERALRRISVHRGYDPSEFSLISFGGAGSLHAVFLAKALHIKEVIVPPNPGIFSALGLLIADTVRDYSLTVMLRGSETGYAQLRDLFRTLTTRALEDMKQEGFDPESVSLELSLDMRYVGQSYELTVPFGEGFVETFHREHERVYRYRHDREVEVVNLRVRAVVSTEKPPLPTFESQDTEDSKHAFLFTVKTAFRGEFTETPVYDRELLRWGNRVDGPAIVVEYSSTTLIPPGCSARVDRFGSLLIAL